MGLDFKCVKQNHVARMENCFACSEISLIEVPLDPFDGHSLLDRMDAIRESISPGYAYCVLPTNRYKTPSIRKAKTGLCTGYPAKDSDKKDLFARNHIHL